MHPKIPKITHKRLTDVLGYQPDTGRFFWKIKLGKGYIGDEAGSRDGAGYIRIMIDGERLLAHRLAWFYVHGVWPKLQIDHKDNNASNNAIDNLREATPSQNQTNKPLTPKSTTGFKGVSYHKRQNVYLARIRVNRKLIHLGCYRTAEEGHAAYMRAANDVFGEFAKAS